MGYLRIWAGRLDCHRSPSRSVGCLLRDVRPRRWSGRLRWGLLLLRRLLRRLLQLRRRRTLKLQQLQLLRLWFLLRLLHRRGRRRRWRGRLPPCGRRWPRRSNLRPVDAPPRAPPCDARAGEWVGGMGFGSGGQRATIRGKLRDRRFYPDRALPPDPRYCLALDEEPLLLSSRSGLALRERVPSSGRESRGGVGAPQPGGGALSYQETRGSARRGGWCSAS